MKQKSSKEIVNGCGLVTNRGKCGKNNYLCSICNGILKSRENYKKKLNRFDLGKLFCYKDELKFLDKCAVDSYTGYTIEMKERRDYLKQEIKTLEGEK